MEELVAIMGSLTRILVVLGGGLSTFSVVFAGFSLMTANGDPHKLGQAKMGVAGAIGGMVLVGIAFIVPGIISRTVIEPAGGQALITEQGLNCDDVLKQQLVFQRGASTSARMNILINQIQSQRSSECNVDLWNPTIVNVDNKDVCGTPDMGDKAGHTNGPAAGSALVGSTIVPTGLTSRRGTGVVLRGDSGRDANNNIIVYFGAGTKPSDSSACWLYSANLRSWDQSPTDPAG